MTSDKTPETPLEAITQENEDQEERGWMFWSMAGIGGVMGVCLVLFLIAVGIGLLSGSSTATADFVSIARDLLLILMVLQGMLIGIGLLVVIFQLAALLNVLQSEIDPVMDSARETATTVKGTAQFISRHVTEPVIKTHTRVRQAQQFTKEASGLSGLMKLYQETLERMEETTSATSENEDDFGEDESHE